MSYYLYIFYCINASNSKSVLIGVNKLHIMAWKPHTNFTLRKRNENYVQNEGRNGINYDSSMMVCMLKAVLSLSTDEYFLSQDIMDEKVYVNIDL